MSSDDDVPAPSPSAAELARRASREAKSMREESGSEEVRTATNRSRMRRTTTRSLPRRMGERETAKTGEELWRSLAACRMRPGQWPMPAPAPDTPRRRPGTGEPGRSQEPAAPAGAAVRAGLPAVDLRTGAVRNARHTRHTRLETHEHTSTRTQHATKNKSEKTPSQDTLLAHERGEGSDQVQRSWVKTRGIGAVRSGGLAALLVALASAAAREQLLRALEDERRPVEL
jgi:hypothetical protein